ncbi:hypothetical protein [Flavihumibacter sp.]|uniref:hypothetical protein n=1 Tax=Flavihumibacter sp. TaxID=1913981 RepID=UPI002FC9C737
MVEVWAGSGEIEGWRDGDGGMEGWRDGDGEMEGWRDGRNKKSPLGESGLFN